MGLENRRSPSPVIPSYDMLCDDGENEALVAVFPRLGHGRRCCFCLEPIYGVLVHMEDGSAVHWGCSLIHVIWREIRAERRHQRRLATWSHSERFNAVRARRRRPLGPRPPPRLRSCVADSLLWQHFPSIQPSHTDPDLSHRHIRLNPYLLQNPCSGLSHRARSPTRYCPSGLGDIKVRRTSCSIRLNLSDSGFIYIFDANDWRHGCRI